MSRETGHKALQKEMASSELRYRRLFETAQDGILILNAQTGEITDVNPFLVDMLGFSKKELSGKKLWEIGFFQDEAASRQAFRVLQNKGYVRYEDLPLETKDGKPMEVEFVSNVYTIDGEKVIQCNIRDITARRKAEEALRKSEKLYHSLFTNMLDGFAYCRMIFEEGRPQDFIYLEVNSAFEKLTGLKDVVGRRVTEIIPGLKESNPELFEIYGRVALTGKKEKFELYLKQLARWFAISVYSPEKGYFVAIFDNISENKQAEELLNGTMQELRRRSKETLALLEASGAVLRYKEFESAARSIFDSCRSLIGASGGYIALTSQDGRENEVLFLEAGGRPCDVDPGLPMPIRGLRGVVYRTGEAAYRNDFAKSEWASLLPSKHVDIDNVLFAPLVIEKRTVGLLGLANKPDGFTQNDADMATAFGRLVAISLQNSRMLEALENSEKSLLKEREALAKAKNGLEIRVRERTAELEKMAEEMRILAKRLVEAQEEERRAIARELHDETGQSLTILKLLVSQAMKSPTEEALPVLTEALKVSDEVIGQMRSLSLKLRPTMLDDLGLLPALNWLIGQYTLKTNIQVDFVQRGIRNTFTPEVNITAYRIVQEALTNVARHAGVKRVLVRANVRRGNLYLRIEDYGRGFDMSALAVGTSTGLSSMRERCGSLGGKLTVKSSPGIGTTVACKLPVGPKKE